MKVALTLIRWRVQRWSSGKVLTHYKPSNSPFWYVQIKNPQTGKYISQRSTRETEESAALRVISDWMKNELPGPHGRAYPISQTYNPDGILHSIKMADWDTVDACTIISALKQRGLIDLIPEEVEPRIEDPPFVPWLYRMWDFDESPRVREIDQHGQRIDRR